jgi:hypothetical protein
MQDYMTKKEIYEAFPDEWILLKNPKTKKNLELLGGTVMWHSKDRDEVYGKAIELKLKHSGFLYTGRVIPEGTAAIL